MYFFRLGVRREFLVNRVRANIICFEGNRTGHVMIYHPGCWRAEKTVMTNGDVTHGVFLMLDRGSVASRYLMNPDQN